MLFNRGPLLGSRIIFFAALSILLMVLDHKQQHLQSLRAILSNLVSPIHYLVDRPIKMFNWLESSFSTHQTLLAENAMLRGQQILMEARLQRLLALENENQELRALLKSTPRIGNGKVQAAQLLAVDSDPFMQEVVLDKGGHDGVYAGQPVLDANGIVGQIIQVNAETSRVMLLTDTRSAIPVQLSRNGVRAIVTGTGNAGVLRLAYVSDTMDVRPGDELVSSGLGMRYPAGYPVGTINSVVHSSGEQFAIIKVLPKAQLNRNTWVLLFWPEKTPHKSAAVTLNSHGVSTNLTVKTTRSSGKNTP